MTPDTAALVLTILYAIGYIIYQHVELRNSKEDTIHFAKIINGIADGTKKAVRQTDGNVYITDA